MTVAISLIYDEDFVRRHGDEQPPTHASCVAEPRWEHDRFRVGSPVNWPESLAWEEGFDLTEADDRYAEINPVRRAPALRSAGGVNRTDRLPPVQDGCLRPRVARGVHPRARRGGVGEGGDPGRGQPARGRGAPQGLPAARLLPLLADVPAPVLSHVGSWLGLGSDVRASVDPARTLVRYRGMIRDRVGVRYDPEAARKIAEDTVRMAAQSKENPADLINVALEELVKAGYELPGYTTLDEIAGRLRSEVNHGFFLAIERRVDPAGRACSWAF